MKKEEFLKRKDEILSKIKDLKQTMSELNKQYISSNEVFAIGTKVKYFNKRHNKTEFGWIASYFISKKDDVVPGINPAKKDGERSKMRVSSADVDENSIEAICE